MSKNRDQIVAYCNDTLKLHEHHDYGPMGLQVAGDEKVSGIACAVSVNLDVIERTKEAGANLLIVHHGLFWNNESRLHAPWEARVNALDEAGITLLAYHLALDAHPKIGNNILLARAMGLQSLTPWEDIGWSGVFNHPYSYLAFGKKIGRQLGAEPIAVITHEWVERVAVIAGGAAQYIVNAHRDGFDTFVTGEPSEPSYNLAHDLGMNFFAFGHDKTERSGVQALARQVSKRFNVRWSFMDSENPV